MTGPARPLPLPPDADGDALSLLLESVQALRKELTELRSRVEANDYSRKLPHVPTGNAGGGIGLGEALALIKSTQNDTVQLITGLLQTVSKQQADTQSAFFKGIQFNKQQTAEILSQLSAEDINRADANHDGNVSLGEFAEVVLQKGIDIFSRERGGGGGLNGMEGNPREFPPTPAPGPRPAAPGYGGVDPEEDR
jgi:hypothetical protein